MKFNPLYWICRGLDWLTSTTAVPIEGLFVAIDGRINEVGPGTFKVGHGGLIAVVPPSPVEVVLHLADGPSRIIKSAEEAVGKLVTRAEIFGVVKSRDSIEKLQKILTAIGDILPSPDGPKGPLVCRELVDQLRGAGVVLPPSPALDTIPEMADRPAPAKKLRNPPFVHVTTVAHAGYSLIVDALKAFISERGYEPNLVCLDQAAETVLRQYAIEQTWFTPVKSDVSSAASTEEHIRYEAELEKNDFRRQFLRLLGCTTVFDCPSFRFAYEGIDPTMRKAPPDQPRTYKAPYTGEMGGSWGERYLGAVTSTPLGAVASKQPEARIANIDGVPIVDYPDGERWLGAVASTEGTKKFL